MAENIARDPGNPRFRQVPRQGACGFCMMLASRGFVYEIDTAIKTSSGARYHDQCKCTAEPQYPGEAEPPFVQKIREAWYETAYPDGRSKSPDEQRFFNFVNDGGLGDRPIPGRDSEGNYRKTVDGEDVPFRYEAVKTHIVDHEKKTGLWYHIANFPTGKKPSGGHLSDHARQWQQWIARGKKYTAEKTLFPEGYTFEDLKYQTREVLKNPTLIYQSRKSGAYLMRREFDDITLEVVVIINSNIGEPELKTAYPVAGKGAVVKKDGSIIDLSKYADRRGRR